MGFGCTIRGPSRAGSYAMVGVAQLVEHRIVIPTVVGSSPIVHPKSVPGPLAQLVEQVTLNHLVVGSSPTRPTKFFSDPTQRGNRVPRRVFR